MYASELGGSRSGFTVVGVASVLVLQANRYRKKSQLTNDSANVIFVDKGPEAALNSGIRLNANGGVWENEPDTFGRLWTGPISAISAVAAQNLCWTEDW